jgi:hypothetical protein
MKYMYIHVTVTLFRIDNYINIYNQDGSKNEIKSDSNDVHAYMIIQNILCITILFTS